MNFLYKTVPFYLCFLSVSHVKKTWSGTSTDKREKIEFNGTEESKEEQKRLYSSVNPNPLDWSEESR